MLITLMITDQIGLLSVPLPLLINPIHKTQNVELIDLVLVKKSVQLTKFVF